MGRIQNWVHAGFFRGVYSKKSNYYGMFEAIMNDFTPRSANQTASDKELCYAYEVAER